ncbi:uncharacterized protein LOC113238086 [Hyposmocoma kahamanoa]|uniref:uncharacterized protein LOC113238086 n=1 Tax=Hyposmocoma kahamanoa TaxID=1477025 RepID=UPI000E6D5FCE|nr:uncharacterized protein LOC113238086 [Hyposmocoma kahamanoa]
MEAECPKYENQFLCDESSRKKLRTQFDCVQEVISRQTIDSTCTFSTIHLLKEAMEQLDDRNYVITFPKPTKVQLSCNTQTYNMLNGSFLITLPIHCSLRTPELTIVNSDDIIQGQPLKIMKINYPDGMDNTASPHLNLSSINLRSLHTIQDKIMFKPQLQLQTIPDVLYHTTIPFYIILFGAAVLALAVLARRYYVWKNTQPKPSEKTISIRRDKATETTGNHIYAKPSSPAIFSLKVGK